MYMRPSNIYDLVIYAFVRRSGSDQGALTTSYWAHPQEHIGFTEMIYFGTADDLLES